MIEDLSQEVRLDRCFEESWGLLRRATVDPKHPFRFVVLATQGTEAPGLRYVVLRKIDEQDRLILFTDQRSTKVKEIQKDLNVSLLFYHPKSRQQLRLEGGVTAHAQDAVAAQYWPMVQGENWKAYGSKLAPGFAIDHPDKAYEWSEASSESNFTVLRFTPRKLELLQLKGLTHLRAKFHRQEEGWKGQWLVP